MGTVHYLTRTVYPVYERLTNGVPADLIGDFPTLERALEVAEDYKAERLPHYPNYTIEIFTLELKGN